MITRNPKIKTQWIYVLALTVIFSILLLPIVQHRFQLFQYKQLEENRYRKTPPNRPKFTELPQYIQNLETYIKDSFGFRDLLIKTRNQIDLSFFDVSAKVYVNPRGDLFYREFEDRYRPEIDTASPAHWQALFEKIQYLNTYLKNQGIKLVFVPIPLADSIYPENFPKLKYIGFSQQLYQRFFTFFDQNNIPYVDVVQALLPYKLEPLYYKTDFHYTQVGAFYTMKAILNKLYTVIGSSKKWEYPIEYKTEQYKGGVLNDYLAVFRPLSDTNPVVDRKWRVCAKEMETGWVNICPGYATLPPSVIFANSYMSWILQSGFSDQFSILPVYLILDTKVAMEQRFKDLPKDTKIVIIEFYETDVWMFLYGDVFPKVGSLQKSK